MELDIKINPAEIFTITLTCKVNKSLFLNKDNEKKDLRSQFQNCISQKNQFEIEGKKYKVNSKIFVNGTIQLTGLKSLQQVEKIVKKIMEERGIKIQESEVDEIQARTINSKSSCNYKFISLEKLFNLMREKNIQGSYQNMIYSGLKYIIYIDQKGQARYEQCEHCKKIQAECVKYSSQRSQKDERNNKYFQLLEIEYQEDEKQKKKLKDYIEYYNNLQKKPSLKMMQRIFQAHCYKVSLIIFRSGSISIMGARRLEDKEIVLEKLNLFLKENYSRLIDEKIIQKN